jgi:hypothetical protein
MALVAAIAASLDQRVTGPRRNRQIRESREQEMERKIKFLTAIISILGAICLISITYNFHKEGTNAIFDIIFI